MRRLGAFFFLFKILNYINFGGFRYFFFLWYEDFVDIFFWGGGGHNKIGLVLGVSSMYFRVFSYGKCTE